MAGKLAKTCFYQFVKADFLPETRTAKDEFLMIMSTENTAQNESKELFIWKKEHEEYFLRELLVTEPYMHKPKSAERGQKWKIIMENLNKLEKPKFRVTVRSVRDRFTKMVERYKKLEKEEENATGIAGVEFDEVYQGMIDIFERMDEAKQIWEYENEAEKEKQATENSKAEDMRKKATESLSETRKRKEEEGEEGVKPRRKRKTTEAFSLCQEGLKIKKENLEREMQLREAELEERRLSRQSQTALFQSQQDFFANMQLQQQQFMAQMQQQNLQMLSVMKDVFSSSNGHS